MYDKSKYQIFEFCEEVNRKLQPWVNTRPLVGAKSTVGNHVHMQKYKINVSLHSALRNIFFHFADKTKSNEVKK